MKTGTAEIPVRDLFPTARMATRSGFFLYMSLAFLAIALIGFSTRFVVPIGRGTFVAPPIVYGHAVLLFSWLIFFVAQASLVRVRSIRAHRRLGWFGTLLGVAVVMSGVAVSFHRAHRDLAAGVGDAALRQCVTNLFFILTFGSLVAAAVALRRDIESHKRLLLLATMWAIFPAWGNLREVFPTVEISEVTLYIASYFPILLGIARDRVVSTRVHPVYVWVGALLVALDLTVTLFAAHSTAWLRVGQWLLGETAV